MSVRPHRCGEDCPICEDAAADIESARDVGGDDEAPGDVW